MKKLIIVLLCIALVSFAFASCTYEGPDETEKEIPTETEEDSVESESTKVTEDDGWDIETEESDDETTPDEFDSGSSESHETEETRETEEPEGESELDGNVTEKDTDDKGEDGEKETIPKADNENDGPWDPDEDF